MFPKEQAIEQHGFAVVPGVLSAAEQQELLSQLGPVAGAGRRGLLSQPAVAELACSNRMLALVRPHLPSEPIPVRALFFDKSSEANWLVAWHQDLSLAVRSRIEVPGFSAWSVKEGVLMCSRLLSGSSGCSRCDSISMMLTKPTAHCACYPARTAWAAFRCAYPRIAWRAARCAVCLVRWRCFADAPLVAARFQPFQQRPPSARPSH